MLFMSFGIGPHAWPAVRNDPLMPQDLCHSLAQLAGFERMQSAYKSLQCRVDDHDVFERTASFYTSRIHAIDHVFCSYSCEYKVNCNDGILGRRPNYSKMNEVCFSLT